MDDEVLEDAFNVKTKLSNNDYCVANEKSLEKGSIEHLLSESFSKTLRENSEKELRQNFEKDCDLNEKLDDNFESLKKDVEKSDREMQIYSKCSNKNFSFETLNRDLADIEERLRATRLSWNKAGKPGTNESNDSGLVQKDIVRKSWSLLDIDKRPYSNGSSFNELDNIKRHSGENMACDSPALSESLLKWDYGADIGLTQDDSDDMDPITWPVTAEQAQRDAHAAELNGMNRRMKISLSQGSFLSSPDPEDRQNIISKILAEYKSSKTPSSLQINKTNVSTDKISFNNGLYDDKSAQQIMEQAEAAEKRLRQRLEAVKALHEKDKLKLQNEDDDLEGQSEHKGEVPINPNTRTNFDSSMTWDTSFHKNSSNRDFNTGSVRNQISQSNGNVSTDILKQNSGDDDCKSPTSISNTGRTTTMESTHTSSDYGKAPIFTGDAYGSRKDVHSNEHAFVIYSKHKDGSNEGLKSFEIRDIKGFRPLCGIAPDLDTISSRETLQNIDDKKDNVSTSPRNIKVNETSSAVKETKDKKDLSDNLSDKDISPEHSLQVKWSQFKSMMKEDEYNLFEKTNVRSAVHYNYIPNIKINENGSTYRQQSSATTFTTVTNISPRHDSFAADLHKSLPRDTCKNERSINFRKSGAEDNSKTNNKKASSERYSSTENQRYGSNQYLNSKPRSTKKLVEGSGGGRDNEDNDDEISQTQRRKMRHVAELAKLKKRYGSGALDGETTASELEHDDQSKYKRNLIDKTVRKKQLSQMLTELSKQGVAEDSLGDLTDVSQSSSVDTMLLMNKMSQLLKKKPSETPSKRPVNKYSSDKSHKKYVISGSRKDVSRAHNNKVIESDDAKLVLKHLMLKQKVKWLADCAREEARRRKVRRLEKLLNLYEHGHPVVIPDGLETETATLIGSNRESQEDLNSQTDSTSSFENERINSKYPFDQNFQIESCETNKNRNVYSKSPSLVKQAHVKKEIYPLDRKDEINKSKKKSYPPSKSWNIPLREAVSQGQGDFNDSNNYNLDQSMENENNKSFYRHHSNSGRIQQPVNLTAKERLQLRRELQLARERNAHECQKDIRHSKIGQTKVATGGLSWDVDGDERNRHFKKSNCCYGENVKDKNNIKSELQLAFENKMETFISRSRQRQKRIKLAVDERRYESQMNLERSKLFVESNDPCSPKRRRPCTQPDPLSADTAGNVCSKVFNKPTSQNGKESQKAEKLYRPQRRRFSKSEMKIQSALKYQSLPEVQAKYLDERRKAKMQNNRMKMHLYGEKILQSVLRNRGPWISTHS